MFVCAPSYWMYQYQTSQTNKSARLLQVLPNVQMPEPEVSWFLNIRIRTGTCLRSKRATCFQLLPLCVYQRDPPKGDPRGKSLGGWEIPRKSRAHMPTLSQESESHPKPSDRTTRTRTQKTAFLCQMREYKLNEANGVESTTSSRNKIDGKPS